MRRSTLDTIGAILSRGADKLVHCPKCKQADLVSVVLNKDLKANQCQECEGNWIRTEDYEVWQTKQPQTEMNWLLPNIELNYEPSILDTKAALCPECRRYLSRSKIQLDKPFYIERCPQCNGFWCDRGEWDILTQLGLHYHLEQVFSSEWQMQMREQKQIYSERQALINKIGMDLAHQIFALAEALRQHEHGDFAAAYIMRQVSEIPQSQNQGMGNRR